MTYKYELYMCELFWPQKIQKTSSQGSYLAKVCVNHALMLPGEINISQLQGKIEFNTFLFCKPYN